MKCPACIDDQMQQKIFEWDLPSKSDTDIPVPYHNKYQLFYCAHCGHLYNRINEIQERALAEYYSIHSQRYYDASGCLLPYLCGDYPGSRHDTSTKRYDFLFNFFTKIPHHTRILDFGCGQGGFLSCLYQKGFRYLYGVDVDEYAIQLAKKNSPASVTVNLVDWLSSEHQGYFDVIVLDQVLEHIVHPRDLLVWLSSFLKEDGVFIISVPYAEKYLDSSVFPIQHFCLLEHVQHFTSSSLMNLLTSENYEEATTQAQPKFLIPIIATCSPNRFFKKESFQPKRLNYSLLLDITPYKRLFSEFGRFVDVVLDVVSQSTVLYWGMSREFYFIFSRTLDNCSAYFLADNNTKLSTKSFKGTKIYPPRTLITNNPELVKEALLVISAIGYEDEIYREALELGFPPERIIRPSLLWQELTSCASGI